MRWNGIMRRAWRNRIWRRERRMSATGFEGRFRNWVRWCLEGHPEPHEACGSAEGNWKSPQVWEPDPPGRNQIDPVDIWDALVVQRAFYGLPELHRRTIKFLHFKVHWRRSWIAQKLGCHHTDLDERLRIAKRMLNNRIDMLDSKAHIARNSEHLLTGNRRFAAAGAGFL